jgi:hypothetical protein
LASNRTLSGDRYGVILLAYRSKEATAMDAITPAVITIIAILGLVIFDLLALRFGADSRPTIGDDHARPLGIR